MKNFYKYIVYLNCLLLIFLVSCVIIGIVMVKKSGIVDQVANIGTDAQNVFEDLSNLPTQVDDIKTQIDQIYAYVTGA